MRKGRSQEMGTAFSCGRESEGPKPFGSGAGRQRLPGVQRAAPLPGIKRAAPVGRGRGGSACADAREGLTRNPKGSARGPGAGRQRLRRCKGRPCPESRGGALWPSEVSKAQRPEGFDTLYWVLPVENGCPSGDATCLGNTVASIYITNENGDEPCKRNPACPAITVEPRNMVSIIPSTTTAAST